MWYMWLYVCISMSEGECMYGMWYDVCVNVCMYEVCAWSVCVCVCVRARTQVCEMQSHIEVGKMRFKAHFTYLCRV